MPAPLARKLTLAAFLACFLVPAQAQSAAFRAAMDTQENRNQAEGCAQLLACARTGDGDCQGEVARCYRNGDGLPRDVAESLNWARKGAAQNSRAGLRELALLNYYGTAGKKDFATALVLGQKAVDLGDARAFGLLGTLYLNGEGAAKDVAKALALFRQGAEQGDSYSQRALADMLAKGQGAPKDPVQAAEWERKALESSRRAAERGSVMAQNSLGYLLENAVGSARDGKEAAKWYRKAAEQGHAEAQNNLGALYTTGQGVPKDMGEAAKWYRKAAEQGESYAQASLAFLYMNGQGVPKDEAEAAVWYRKAAEQGDAPSQRNLGNLYESGTGVPRNEREAATWYRKAAEQGDRKASLALANLVFPSSITLVHGDNPLSRLDLRCQEEGDALANCVVVSHGVEKSSAEENKELRARLRKVNLIREEVNNMYGELVAADAPDACKGLLTDYGSGMEAAARRLLPPAVDGRLRKWAAACAAGDLAAFRKTFRKLYPAPAALQSDAMVVLAAIARISENTCAFSVETSSLKMQRIGDDQWQAKDIYKQPINNEKGVERLLTRDPVARKWTYEVRSLPDDGAAGKTAASTGKYQSTSGQAHFATLGCAYVVH